MKGGSLSAAMICAALCLTACAGVPPEKALPGAAEGVSPERSPEDGRSGIEPEQSPFREAPPQTLPPEARSYLETLAGAFRSRDRDFLLSQGEAAFEAEVRPAYDEESYLALLYRIGPYGDDGSYGDHGSYGDDGSRADPKAVRLFPEEIDRIEYGDWEERGPLLEIRGRLIRRGEPPLPCLVMLIWKLREPKIQGRFP